MIKTIGYSVLIILALFTSACDPPPSVETIDIQYLRDSRTELCFATRYGGLSTNSYAMVAVPCTPAVLAVVQGK